MARNKPNYLYAIVSVALVLFIVGSFGLTALHAQRLVELFKEKVELWLELRPDIEQAEISRIVAEVRSKPFVLPESVGFISHEQAAETMRQDLGEESMLEEVPDMLRDIIRFNVKANYLNTDSLNQWRDQMRADTAVADVYTEVANVGNVGENIKKMGWITLVLGILLIISAITLIHNTIRLALYANRFVIKNQELVGATWSYISRPYIVRGVLNGLWSSAIAILLLIGGIWWAQGALPELKDLEDINSILMVFTGLLLLGVLLSGLSTYFVVRKFLSMRVDDLY